jgi:hypothetical protein
LNEKHMAVLVDSPMSSKSFAEMRMQLGFVAKGTAATKGDRMENGCGRLGHEFETLAAHAMFHRGQRDLVVGRLACNVPKSVG